MKKKHTLFLLILLGAVLLRLFIIYSEYHGINSDNGIMGLMAKHILKGEFPVFFYGQPYMGTMEAYIIAFFFLMFGISVNTICLSVMFITTLGIISAYFLGKEIKDKTMGLYAMAIASLPPIYSFWHGLAASGGYPETLLFGNILLIITLRIMKTEKKIKYYAIMGLISGLAFWTHMVIAYYLLPIAIFLLINEKKKILFLKAPLLVIPAFVLGSLPLWIYNIKNGFDTFKLPVSKNLAGGFMHFLNTYPSLISDKPFTWPYYILLSIYITSFMFFVIKQKGQRLLFFMLFLSIIYFFSVSHLARTRSAKYLIPMTTVIIITNSYLAWFLNKKTRFLGYIPLIFILSFNGMDIYKSYVVDKKESYTDHELFEELICFLKKNNLKTNYCTFWISQKLNFISNEEIINANYEGDRYVPYEDAVEASDNIAFIERDIRLEPIFNMLCKNYSRTRIGPFYVYCNFTPAECSGKIIPSQKWKAESNYSNKDLEFAFDRNADTYWGTILNKKKGMYFRLDLGEIHKIYKIALFNDGHWRNFPLDMSVMVSQDGKTWNKLDIPNYPAPLFLSGPRLYWHLQDGRIELVFPSISCRYINIEQNGEDNMDPWEINEIFVWEYLGDNISSVSESIEIYNYLSAMDTKYVYADFWLSAKIDKLSNGRIKTLKPKNRQYPHKKGTSRFLRLDTESAFIINKENLSDFRFNMKKKKFKNYTCFYLDKKPKTNEIFYWSGYGLLSTNRLISTPQGKTPSVFENGIKFLGCDIKKINNSLKIDYYWQLRKIPKDTFVFVHFIKDKTVILQNDHPLLEKFPISEPIRQEEIFKESYTIDNIPSGTYDIEIGLWHPKKNNKRIKITSPAPGKTKIFLGEITL